MGWRNIKRFIQISLFVSNQFRVIYKRCPYLCRNYYSIAVIFIVPISVLVSIKECSKREREQKKRYENYSSYEFWWKKLRSHMPTNRINFQLYRSSISLSGRTDSPARYIHYFKIANAKWKKIVF